ncbi:type III secretion protein J [Breoghania corrubedonensis]|uniref:Lipoprotein n=1 Tax=Breoghania corrubedonensis TaxID=665038 RepID=A0A2T5UYU4_9HYPH|nr:type III secretion inner membrane ring lipoprotein SctJ [Breoghania corrubedonensis]PTW56650.1 type III secretion protein J [Breoghania corrubedonensis]
MLTVRKTVLFRCVFILGVCVLLGACKLDLYSGLTERDANEMLAILQANGVSADKQYKAKEGVTLLVEESELPRAIQILNQNGYPREVRDSIGNVFKKSGIMSSPFEERVRFVYALAEEVSRTLSEIDGVLTARVHIVLPEDPGLGEKIKPSSAAVFIKHRIGVNLDFFVPQIRRLVANSIEGVDYESVSVVMVEAERPQVLNQQPRSVIAELLPGLGVREGDQGYFWQLAGGLLALIAVLLLSNLATGYGFMRARSARRKMETRLVQQTQAEE